MIIYRLKKLLPLAALIIIVTSLFVYYIFLNRITEVPKRATLVKVSLGWGVNG